MRHFELQLALLQKIYSPYDGIILYIVATSPMSKGEPVAMVGRFGKDNDI
ncbi:MAG: hypothetical protein PF484_03580 [Bacteroidales bacterium]|jgi:hypothetical protein|nr:hypothetical protein [Bacteroidales bacterium]